MAPRRRAGGPGGPAAPRGRGAGPGARRSAPHTAASRLALAVLLAVAAAAAAPRGARAQPAPVQVSTPGELLAAVNGGAASTSERRAGQGDPRRRSGGAAARDGVLPPPQKGQAQRSAARPPPPPPPLLPNPSPSPLAPPKVHIMKPMVLPSGWGPARVARPLLIMSPYRVVLDWCDAACRVSGVRGGGRAGACGWVCEQRRRRRLAAWDAEL
jgi:hypothetical protein